jgi:hypothetical protein
MARQTSRTAVKVCLSRRSKILRRSEHELPFEGQQLASILHSFTAIPVQFIHSIYTI